MPNTRVTPVASKKPKYSYWHAVATRLPSFRLSVAGFDVVRHLAGYKKRPKKGRTAPIRVRLCRTLLFGICFLGLHHSWAHFGGCEDKKSTQTHYSPIFSIQKIWWMSDSCLAFPHWFENAFLFALPTFIRNVKKLHPLGPDFCTCTLLIFDP